MLAHILFPLGDSLKHEVRKEAACGGLPSATRPDSQGICFLGELNMREFLSHYIERRVGAIHNLKGEVIGEHDGVALYTIGERHGFRVRAQTATASPRYIIKKDMQKNILTVDTNPPVFASGDSFTLSSWNVLDTRVDLTATTSCSAVVRYHGKRVPAELRINRNIPTITLQSQIDRPSSGQTCVLYRDDVILGSGIIEA
jgi:tRNA-specific 2-thiouridylase